MSLAHTCLTFDNLARNYCWKIDSVSVDGAHVARYGIDHIVQFIRYFKFEFLNVQEILLSGCNETVKREFMLRLSAQLSSKWTC